MSDKQRIGDKEDKDNTVEMQSSVTKWIASERQTFEDKEDKGTTVKRQSIVTQRVASERQTSAKENHPSKSLLLPILL